MHELKIRITHNWLDTFILCLMLYYVLFGIWSGVGINQIQSVIICLCIVRSLFYYIKARKLYSQTVLYIVALVVLFCFNYLAHNDNSLFWDNMSYIIGCWAVVVYVTILLKSEEKWLEKFLVCISRVVNVYMCINIIVMFLQLNESYFLIDKSRIPSVVYYPDYIAGFFGINGTHRLTLFCILFICLNMYVYKFKKVKYYKRIPLFVLLISLLLFALSTQNDNNTFFILYPLFALFLYSILYTIDYKRIGKLCLCVLGGIIALAVVVSTNGDLLKAIGNRFGDIIQVYIFRNKNVWDERTELMTYALVHGKGYFLGSGIGSIKIYSDTRISSHWGMNSLMTFTYFMGIVPLFLYAALHTLMLTSSISDHAERTKLTIRIGMIILFIRELSNAEVCTVLDPTLLLSPGDWIQYECKPKWYKGQNYILKYFLGNEEEEQLLRIAKDKNLIVIDVMDKKSECYISGPSEFIYLIHNASYIVTDSYHGTIFSLLFKKKFALVQRKDSICSMKSRFNTLFQCLGIPFEDTNIEALMNDSCLDYDGIIHKNLQTEKEKSLRYLKNIVTDVSNLK